MDTQKKMRVHLSALVDGELSAADLELAMAALGTPDGQQAWETYHRIGDELRAQAAPLLSGDFAAKLAGRLDAENPPLRRAAQKNADGTTGRRTGARASAAGRRAAPVNGAAPAGEARHDDVQASPADELPVDGKAVMLPKPAIASVS